MDIYHAITELENEKNIRFVRLVYLVSCFFGQPRIKGSHHIFKTPFRDQPLLNLQTEKGKAKPYQTKQVRQALIKLKDLLEQEGVA